MLQIYNGWHADEHHTVALFATEYRLVQMISLVKFGVLRSVEGIEIGFPCAFCDRGAIPAGVFGGDADAHVNYRLQPPITTQIAILIVCLMKGASLTPFEHFSQVFHSQAAVDSNF
jgi:hypothetical protein